MNTGVVATSSSRDLPNPEIKPTSLALSGGSFTTEPPGKPIKERDLGFRFVLLLCLKVGFSVSVRRQRCWGASSYAKPPKPRPSSGGGSWLFGRPF